MANKHERPVKAGAIDRRNQKAQQAPQKPVKPHQVDKQAAESRKNG